MNVYIKKSQFEEIIARKNINQDELSSVLGVTRPYLSMLKSPEKYDFCPSPDLRDKILLSLGCKFDDIFFVSSVRFNEQNRKKGLGGQPKPESATKGQF